MTCNILTPGHIKCLELLVKRGNVTVGLLTSEALKGYKTELQPFEDRNYILETIAMALGSIEIVPQITLDPAHNIRKYKCGAIASGDGFEPSELKAIKRLRIKAIDLKLRGETLKTYSSTKIWKKK